jgi:(E)-4-hydroxy-3-methylbut-2-enyl-diphosphate synthase
MVGNVEIGAGAPISVQSMTKTRTTDVDATLEQIACLASAGCEIVRVAVPTRAAARSLARIVASSPIPVVADIHFAGILALDAIEAGAHGVRINPGNMRNRKSLEKIADAAREAGIKIRVGVNSGSISGAFPAGGGVQAEAELLSEAAIGAARLLEERDFHDIVISAKSSSVRSTIEAYRLIAAAGDYPLHLGVTAAGPLADSAVRCAIGIGSLLSDGIGDTIRVSVTGEPVQEVALGRQILDALDLRRFGVRIISCPTCGRCVVDLPALVEEARAALAGIEEPLTVAVMGCVVNGPGEAKGADVGAAFSGNAAWIFRRGRKVRKVSARDVPGELAREAQESRIG